MIEFICPGCTKNFEANRAFVGFETRCLRCGTVILIPIQTGETPATLSSKSLPTPKPAARRPVPTPRHETATTDLDDSPDHSGGTATATANAVAPPVPRRRALRAEPTPETSTPVVSEPTVDVVVRPTSDTSRARKKKQWIIGGSVGGVLLIASLAYAFSGKTPKATPRQDPPPPAPKQETPTPPPPTPKAPTVYEIAPMPRAVRPPVEYELTAAALLLEYGEGPATSVSLPKLLW